MIRSPVSLSVMFVVAFVLYALSFWVMVTVDPGSAESRYTILTQSGAPGRAISHGEQLLALKRKDGTSEEDLVDLKLSLGVAHENQGDAARAVELFGEVLTSEKAESYPATERADLRTRMATLEMGQRNLAAAAAIYADFLDQAGDEAARVEVEDTASTEAWYIEQVIGAQEAFTERLPPTRDEEYLTGSKQERLASASDMTQLGGFYAGQPEGSHAAAGLLSAAYITRLKALGPAHQDTLQTGLMLGDIYQRIGRDAEALDIYLKAFHAQEQDKGSNSPELSLYLRLLVDIYKKQGRMTEAEALNQHIRRIFQDAFGSQRYKPNQNRDRRSDINRPISRDFPLNAKFIPPDLIAAGNFDIPLSKAKAAEEMSIRTAQEADIEGATMPSQLKAVLAHCSAESGETLSLRSGYRSYKTQTWLYNNTDHNGKVTAPGTSEHQLGLAVDIDVERRLMRRTDRAYQCFEEGAWSFGFLLTYPEGNTYLDGPDTYEPWHWRYVGRQTALLYREIGPLGMPQEFLAALPCYEQRAMAGVFPAAKDRDICLDRLEKKSQSQAASRSSDAG